MRLKRLCERKAGGTLQVDEETHRQWLSGNREELSLALVKAIKLYGSEGSKRVRDAVRVPRC